MTNNHLDYSFIVPISSSAHRLAEQFRRLQSDPKKAKQVYLNTLAVSAVNFYLRCMGILTDWEASFSNDPVMQSLMDVADLPVKNRGKLECLPVLPDDKVIHFPLEVSSDRIGYIVVQFEPSLREATLLGYIQTVPESGELTLNQLHPLEELLERFYQVEPPEVERQVKLSRWFENTFEVGWQSLEALFGTEGVHRVFSLRNVDSDRKGKITGAKLLDLEVQLGSHSVHRLFKPVRRNAVAHLHSGGHLQNEARPASDPATDRSVALLVALSPLDEQKLEINVQVHPVGEETYLPPNLILRLLSDSEEIIQEVQSRNQDNYIQLLRFRGPPGEIFKLQVVLGDATTTETFAI